MSRRQRHPHHHRHRDKLLPPKRQWRPPYLAAIFLVGIQILLLTGVTHCAKTFFMHWNTTNSIFRIDNTDHIIDVNKNNLQFEYDQVHIICPVYEPGTFENETEKYIIYNVSKVEYETCRITNADPRIIAICDKPQKLMFFTITFRPFTPQPGGLEFLPGNDYYFISTSSKDDLHRRIGGRCSTNNMKVVFKVCCSELPLENSTQTPPSPPTGISINTNIERISPVDSAGGKNDGAVNSTQSNIVQSTISWPSWSGAKSDNNSSTATPILTPRPPSLINNHNINKNSVNRETNHPGGGGATNTNNHKPTKKTNEYDKHQNEVVKNEELTYNNNSMSLICCPALLLALCLLLRWCQR